jgi:antitoxin MazE
MRARVSRWGNSLAIRLPKAVAGELGVGEGQSVDLTVRDGAVVMRAARRRYRLADLLAQIRPGSVPEAIEYRPVGKELL